jgi:ATP-dependent Clp protease ATP-binding subunit ClpA
MTSNLGSDEFNEKASQIGFDVSESQEDEIMKDYTKAKENVKKSIGDYFSPEFVNRIDKIVIFNPLDKENIQKIVTLNLGALKTKLENKNLTLSYNKKVIEFITKTVYNPEF